MSREDFKDDIFNTIVNKLEKDYLVNGSSHVQMNVAEFSSEEIDLLTWEAEEEHEMKVSDIEINECFFDAFDYIDELYHITATNQLQDDIHNTRDILQCL